MREVLAESALTAVIGGIAGLVVATLALAALGAALTLPLDVQATTVTTSMVASALSGVVAGWYPARRATQLTVIDALRVE